MDNLEEFKSHYEREILPFLAPLNDKRKVVHSSLRRLGLIFILLQIFVIFLTSIIFSIVEADWELMIPVIMFVLVLSLIAYLIIYSARTHKLSLKFKEMVIKKIIHRIDADAIYKSSEFISEDYFNKSKLFGSYDSYKGEDFVMMNVYDKERKNYTEITFSELNVTDETTDSKGNKSTTTIFNGIFYKIQFNKTFNAQLYLNSPRRKNMELEDNTFNKMFRAYTTDQVEARYILSTSFMKRLKEFQRSLGKAPRIRVAFVDNEMYVAVSSSKDFLEPKLNKDLKDFNNILPYYLEVDHLIKIVDILNLNLRIWN